MTQLSAVGVPAIHAGMGRYSEACEGKYRFGVWLDIDGAIMPI